MRSATPPLPIIIRRRLWGLFLLGLSLRLVCVLWHVTQGVDLRHDPAIYLTLAANLGHGVFSMFHPSDIPDTIKMPGYPVFLWLLGGHVTWALLVQALLSALKVPVVYVLARRVGSNPAFALGAAAMMALEPVDILLSAQLMSETLFTLFLLGGTTLFIPGARWRTLVLSALFFAMAAWVRPNGVWLLALAGLVGWAFIHRSAPKPLVFIVLGVLLTVPWAWRNHQVLDRFYWGDSGVVAAAYYQVPDVLYPKGHSDRSARSKALHDRAASIDWEDRQQFHAFFDDLRAEVCATFQSHPFTWAQVQLGKSLRIFLAPGRGHARMIFREAHWAANAWIAWSAFFSLLLLLSSVIWIWRIRRMPSALRGWLLLAAAVVISGALTTTDARFKNPAMPLLLVGVAWAAQQVVARTPRSTVTPSVPSPPV